MTDAVRRDLHTIARAWAACHGPVSGQRHEVRGVPGSRPPTSVDRLDVAAGIVCLPVLTSWERLIREERRLTPWGELDAPASIGAEIGRVCVFLADHLDWAAEQGWWDDLAGEVRGVAHAHARAAGWIVRPEQRTFVAPCECGAQVIVETMGETVYCGACSTAWVAAELMARHPNVDRCWLTGDLASVLAGVDERTLRRWAAAGSVRREQGRYSLGDLLGASRGD